MKTTFSVRSKIWLTIVASIIALSLVGYFVSDTVLLQSYLTIERQGVVQDLGRAKDAISEFSRQQAVKLEDWSRWDDSHQYAIDRNQEYIDTNINDAAPLNLDLNAMLYFDLEGALINGIAVDLFEGVAVSPEPFLAGVMNYPALTKHETLESVLDGIIMLPEGPLLVTSRPLRLTGGVGPSSGTLVFARYLDESKIEEIGEITHLALRIFPYENSALPEDVARAKTALSSSDEPYFIEMVTNELIRGYALLPDIDGAPALVLRIESPRPVFAQGQLSFFLFTGLGALALLLFGLAIVFLLEHLVIARFVRLTKEVEKINSVHDLSLRMEEGERDEIGKLAARINRMLGWLLESRKAEEESKQSIVLLLSEVKSGKDAAEKMVEVRTKELADEKARLLASIHSLSFGFALIDSSGAVLLSNKALLLTTGLSVTLPSVAEISAKLGKGMAKGSREFVLASFVEDCIREKKAGEEQEVLFGKKFLRFFLTPVDAEEGPSQNIIGYILLVENITEAKVLERGKEEFFSIASHELRTPLTAIRGNTDLLLSTADRRGFDARAKQMLEDIDVSSKRLIAMVNDFLEVSRLEQGRIQIKREPFSLEEVVNDVARNLHELASTKGLSLSVQMSQRLPKVLGDRARTEQVLDNLVGNAVKFTKEGGVTIELQEKDGQVLAFVKDTGIGISKPNQAHLFRKFQQAGEQVLARDDSQSTGLGLYISKLIMEAQGGTVTLKESTLGKGSTFVLALPAAETTA